MKLSAILEPLLRAGVDPDVILDAIRAFEAQQEAGEEATKEKARARWRKWKCALGIASSELAALSEYVKSRDNFTCVYCGSRVQPLHCDHIIPLSQGGTNDLDNLATACRECNSGKSGRTPEQWRGAQ